MNELIAVYEWNIERANESRRPDRDRARFLKNAMNISHILFREHRFITDLLLE